MKQIAATLAALIVLTAGILIGASFNAPSTFLHVVIVKWKAESTPQQQQEAIEGIRKMAASVPGVKNVWLKKVKVQPADYSTVFAIEFESKAAFDAYADNAAHKAWGEKLSAASRRKPHAGHY